nr:60S acidic ribosomal protein P0 [Cryptomonas sp.]
MKNQKKIYRKSQYFEKLNYLFSKYTRILLVNTSNVNSNQIQKCRKDLSDNSVMVIGKNTLIRKALRYQLKKNPDLEDFYSYISGNVGLIFSEIDPFEIRKILESNRIPAPAKPGQVSQCDVTIPAGPTDVPPEGTSFFQALNIQTKIQKGQIEIQNPVTILTKGQIVGSSEASLLHKLNILPFSKELTIKQIFDLNTCYGPSVLDMKSEDILGTVAQKVHDLSCASIIINYPDIGYLKNSIKKVLTHIFCLAGQINYKLKEVDINCKIESFIDENAKNNTLENDPIISKNVNMSADNETSEDFGLNLFD